MRLLSKNEVASAIVTDKKTLIDEGIRIAQKVDALRETSAQEESKLRTFRDTSLKSIREEIDVLVEKKNSLIEELKVLEERKAISLIPVHAEWEKIAEKKKEISDMESFLEGKWLSLAQKDSDYETKIKDLEVERKKISEDKKSLFSKIDETNQLFSSAQSALQNTIAYSDKRDKDIEKREKDVSIREAQVGYDEVDFVNKNNNLSLREKSVESKEKTVNDKYLTLERTIKRFESKKDSLLKELGEIESSISDKTKQLQAVEKKHMSLKEEMANKEKEFEKSRLQLEELEKEILSRRNRVYLREHDVSLREKNVLDKEVDLNIKEQNIKDNLDQIEKMQKKLNITNL